MKFADLSHNGGSLSRRRMDLASAVHNGQLQGSDNIEQSHSRSDAFSKYVENTVCPFAQCCDSVAFIRVG